MPKDLCEQLIRERAAKLPNETGGYLLGRRRGPHLEVTGATLQGPLDIATPYSFDRVDPCHFKEAVEAWQKDEGRTAVIGDWHSHPIGTANASLMDERAWKLLGKSAHASVIGLILAPNNVAVYLASPRWSDYSIQRCPSVEESESEIVFHVKGALAVGLSERISPTS